MARRKTRTTGPRVDAPTPAALPSPIQRRWVRWAVAVAMAMAAAGGFFWVRGGRPSRRGPNLLLVTIDTLRADRVGAYGYAGATTPTLDGLAVRGARFASVETAVPLTGPAHSTILTGSYPPVHGVRDNVVFPLDPRHPTLAAILKRQGYRTAAFVAAYPVAKSFGFGQGFDTFDEGFHEAAPGAQGAERPGNEVADAALKWLDAAGPEPFFVWIHLYDPHAPYKAPPPYDTQFADRPYDGEIAFADAQLGRILDGLRVHGHADDTVVAALADHGESLGEHGEKTHAILVYEATLRVPLVLAGPGVPKGRVVPERVGTVDLLPTLLGLLGAPAPAGLAGRDLRGALLGRRLSPQPLYGESLFGRLNCRWASLRTWFNEDWKLIEGHQPELYNLAEDPGEQHDLAVREPERVARMRRSLEAAVQSMAPQGDSAKVVAISSEQEEQLRSLGYVSGGSAKGPLDDPTLPDPRTRVHLYERLQNAMLVHGPLVPAAIAEMEAVALEDPGNPYAYFALGNLAYRDGRLGLAERAYAKGLELDPDRPGMRLPYGHLLRDEGKLAESERELRITLSQTTADDDRTRISLAETLTARGRLVEAEGLVRAVLERAPNHVEAVAAEGRLRIAQGKPREAIACFEKIAHGTNPEPWIEMGRAYLALGEPAHARQAAQGALVVAPDHPWALAVIGHALVQEGHPSEGLAVLGRALAVRPKRAEAWLTLANAFAAAGDPRRAAVCRREATADPG